MIHRRKLRRLPLPPAPSSRPAPASHWLDRHEAEREDLDEKLRNRIEAADQDGKEARR